ncbi:unnamed protein product [Linum trigynum]|uniref:Uncharacterized protein n=1 Tax=Linum trigynum TaxID=586398 RepID=A0AAV2E3Q6_9ROSI
MPTRRRRKKKRISWSSPTQSFDSSSPALAPKTHLSPVDLPFRATAAHSVRSPQTYTPTTMKTPKPSPPWKKPSRWVVLANAPIQVLYRRESSEK